MAVEVLDSVASLQAIAPDWNAMAADCPMRGFDWLEAWWRHYRPGGELFVLVVQDWTGQPIGVAPWRTESTTHRGRVIRWLGDGEVCSDHLSVLVRDPSHTPLVAAEIADFLIDQARDWDLLRLDDCDRDDAVLNSLTDALRQRDCCIRHTDAGACWVIDLPGDWEAFLAMQSKSHRKQLRRTERRAAEGHAPVWRPVTNGAELEAAWPVFVDLHQRRRQSLGEPGCFSSPRFASFHREVAGRLLESGRLRLSLLELDGRPAAADYQFAGNTTTFAYQGGLDPHRLEEEPGRLSLIALIKAAMDEGKAKLDLLRGDEPYKPHWRAQPKPTCHLRVVPQRRSAVVRAEAAALVGRLKTGIRTLRGSTR